jgi:alpha-tubulin suppressor-like RCC1 family protein
MHDEVVVRAWTRVRRAGGLRAVVVLLVLLRAVAAGGQPGERQAQAAGPRAATTASGKPWAWGWNLGGQLGRGSHSDSPWPGAVDGLDAVVALAAGGLHSLALRADGTVWAWGGNTHGQLGTGSSRGSVVPVPVAALHDIVAIAAGPLHSLALQRGGSVWAWGANFAGELGRGDRCTDATPTACFHGAPHRVDGLGGVIAVAAGGLHSLALRANGTVWAWGSNRNGQVGLGTPCAPTDRACASTTPVQVPGLPRVVAIAGGGEHSLALTASGTVWAWGANGSGQLGRAPGTTPACSAGFCTPLPARVSGLSHIVAIAAGDDHSLALDAMGRVWAWGGNAAGQLGSGSTVPTGSPIQVGLPPVVAIAGGLRSSEALTAQGTVWTWGWNGFGQLGIGTTSTSLVPVRVRQLGRVDALAPGCEALHRLVLLVPLAATSDPASGGKPGSQALARYRRGVHGDRAA